MSKTNKHDKYDEPSEDHNLDAEFASDRNPSPTLSRAATQEGYTAERFKAGHRKASIFTMVVLAAGCAVLGLLYYQTVKNLHSVKDNLVTVQQQNSTLQSQLKTVQVAGPAAPATPAKSNSQAGVTVKIPELGLQYQDNGQFSDLIWTLNYDNRGNEGYNFVNPTMALTSRQVVSLQGKKLTNNSESQEHTNCGIENMGRIMKVNKSKADKATINQQIKDNLAVDRGNYYLIYAMPQQSCSGDFKDVGALQEKITGSDLPKDFLKALQPIK